jgi:hypothetical protein
MAEPADVHKIPPKPEHAVKGPQEAPGVADDINLGPEEARSPMEALEKMEKDLKDPGWQEHVITGVKHVKFKNRKIGELNAGELAIIETQWLPAIRQEWENATDAQRLDARMFESAIAYYKMAKPF